MNRDDRQGKSAFRGEVPARIDGEAVLCGRVQRSEKEEVTMREQARGTVTLALVAGPGSCSCRQDIV